MGMQLLNWIIPIKKEDIMSDNAEMLPPIKVKVGEFIEIKVPSNRTTGFCCCLKEMPSCIFLESSEYVSDKPVHIGTGGSQVYNFLAVDKGSGSIDFRQVKYTHPELTIESPGPMEKRFVIVE